MPRRQNQPRIRCRGEHDQDEAHAHSEAPGPRAEEGSRRERQHDRDPADVADVVKPLENLSEDRSAEKPSIRHLSRRHDVEHGRRRDRPEGEQAPNPDHDAQEGCIAQRKHPVIIIEGSPRRPGSVARVGPREPRSAPSQARRARLVRYASGDNEYKTLVASWIPN